MAKQEEPDFAEYAEKYKQALIRHYYEYIIKPMHRKLVESMNQSFPADAPSSITDVED